MRWPLSRAWQGGVLCSCAVVSLISRRLRWCCCKTTVMASLGESASKRQRRAARCWQQAILLHYLRQKTLNSPLFEGGRRVSVLRFDEVLFGHWHYSVPCVPASVTHQAGPENELKYEIDQVSLLPADFFCGIRSAAFRAGEGGSIYLVLASAARDKRHFAIL